MHLIFLLILFVSSFTVLGLLIYIIWRENIKKTKFGINFKAMNPMVSLKCPTCNAKLPKIRIPQNKNQLLWGGWTCRSCKTEYDKHLNKIEN